MKRFRCRSATCTARRKICSAGWIEISSRPRSMPRACRSFPRRGRIPRSGRCRSTNRPPVPATTGWSRRSHTDWLIVFRCRRTTPWPATWTMTRMSTSSAGKRRSIPSTSRLSGATRKTTCGTISMSMGFWTFRGDSRPARSSSPVRAHRTRRSSGSTPRMTPTTRTTAPSSAATSSGETASGSLRFSTSMSG